MKILYATLAIIAITIVSVFTFKDDILYYNYAKYSVKNDAKVLENVYFYEDNFYYVDDYNKLEINDKNELYETVYYLVNSGAKSARRYFNIDYTDYESDYNNFFSVNNKLNLNYINNFVHPYNTFDSIGAVLKGYTLEIAIEYKYTEEQIKLIDNKVNEIINNLITNNMKDDEKVKIIHDYIINNTVYDEDFCIEEDPDDCVTTSPYQSDTAYGVLFEHYGICSGYTDLMAIFLTKLNIINYRVTNDSHTWNAVKIDNAWYHLDATWDDPISEENILSHDYFLITTNEDNNLKKSHVFDKEVFIELS